jgi:hypothetical protein
VKPIFRGQRQGHRRAAPRGPSQRPDRGERCLSPAGVRPIRQLCGDRLRIAEGARRQGQLPVSDGEPGTRFDQTLHRRAQARSRRRPIESAQIEPQGVHAGQHPVAEKRRRDESGDAEAQHEQQHTTAGPRRDRSTTTS